MSSRIVVWVARGAALLFVTLVALEAPAYAAGVAVTYGGGHERVKKTEGGHTTYYFGPDFEIRDGVPTLYASVAGRRVAKIEHPAAPAVTVPDLAPAAVDGARVVPMPDRKIAAGDAWIAQALVTGVLVADTHVDDATVDAILAASARHAVEPPAEVVTYLHADHLGSTVATTDATGALIARWQTYPFGSDRGAVASREDYGWNGKEVDASGLAYFGARYYEPRLARWTSADPRFATLTSPHDAAPADLDAYGFVRGNPLLYTDPRGFEPAGEAVHFATESAPADCDGSPQCYADPARKDLHPENPRGNAGHPAKNGKPAKWWGIVTLNGEPYSDPETGYHVSPTSLVFKHAKPPPGFSNTPDADAYVNADTVPFIAVSKRFLKETGTRYGDVGYAYDTKTNRGSFFIVADGSPADHGESSVKLLSNLAGKPLRNANTSLDHRIELYVFPKSRAAGGLRNSEDAASYAARRGAQLSAPLLMCADPAASPRVHEYK